MQKTQLFDLDGKIALVTGASRGIGGAIASLLAQQGAHVFVSSRKIDDCQQVADSIVAAGGRVAGVELASGEPSRRPWTSTSAAISSCPSRPAS